MSSVQRSDVQLAEPASVRPALEICSFVETDEQHDEDWANALTHAIGCILSVIAGSLLVANVAAHGTLWQLLACTVYAGSLSAVYAASTLSHWARSCCWRRRFRTWDQGLIFLLIAGTYTPLAVEYLTGPWHFATLMVWTCALTGFVSKVALQHRIDGISVWMYLALGWLPVVTIPELVQVAPSAVLFWVFAGGMAYSLGSILLMNDHRGRYLHVGWHLSVMVGSALHFYAIWNYAAPVSRPFF